MQLGSSGAARDLGYGLGEVIEVDYPDVSRVFQVMRGVGTTVCPADDDALGSHGARK